MNRPPEEDRAHQCPHCGSLIAEHLIGKGEKPPPVCLECGKEVGDRAWRAGTWKRDGEAF